MLTFREKNAIEEWFETIDYLGDDAYSEIYSLYERMVEKGYPYPTIMETLPMMAAFHLAAQSTKE